MKCAGVFTCHVYDTKPARSLFGVDVDAPTFTERLEDLCAALFYSGVDDKRERAGLSSQSSGWARGNGAIALSYV